MHPIAEKDLNGGNIYPKYQTRNPVAQLLMRNFLRTFDRLVSMTGAGKAHEVGCGEGFLSIRLAQQGFSVRGSDTSAAIIEVANSSAAKAGLHVEFQKASIYELNRTNDAAHLIVCCEVLEHLPDPAAALDVLSELADPFLLVSVPREPIWRVLNVCRGKYVGSLGNTPGHIQHWSSEGFLSFLGRRFDVIQAARPLPWTMALCRLKS